METMVENMENKELFNRLQAWAQTQLEPESERERVTAPTPTENDWTDTMPILPVVSSDTCDTMPILCCVWSARFV